MRGTILLASGLVAFAFAGRAQAQTMPGTPVGTPSVQPVGTRLPSVGNPLPKVGQPPTGYNGAKPGTTADSPFGQGNWPSIDPNLVVAPYPTPKLNSDNFWDKLYQRWLVLFTDDNKDKPTWVPGISRRNRERREKEQMMMRRWQD
jgi:hypothetical protein